MSWITRKDTEKISKWFLIVFLLATAFFIIRFQKNVENGSNSKIDINDVT